jgi:competence protein ComEA
MTPDERRGALLLAALLLLGAGHDLWRLKRDRVTPPVPPSPVSPVVAGDSARPPAAAPATAGRAIAPPTAPLDLNHAGIQELDALPGIGPVLAGRIVEHRRRHGRFGRAEELLAVQGIGPRLLERLRGRITVGPAP